jgi:enoyl-CoA hydratase/carnithine racemase
VQHVIDHEATAGLDPAGGLRLAQDGPVATVWLARPERRNAMTPAMWDALAAVPALLGDDVRLVVVRGEGAGFCAGLDLRLASPEGVPGEGSLADFVVGDDDAVQALVERWQGAFTWLRDPRFLTVAAVHGPAVGGGFQLALAADLRIVADDARFCMREVALGLIPDLTGTKALVDAVGYSRALEICATARWVGAEEAVGIGLASLVVPLAELEGAVSDLCGAVLANSTAAVRAVKALLLEAGGRDLTGQRAAERAAQVPLLRALTGTT